MKDAQDILTLFTVRRRSRTPILNQMRAVRDQYNGDIIIPLPEIDAAELPAVANILQMGLDQSAKRIASTIPDVFYPPTDPGAKRSEERARTRRRANLGWWEQNRMKTRLRRRARYLIGYSNSPVKIKPDFDKRIPMWDIRNPLHAYPCPSGDVDNLTPLDNIFEYSQSYNWLARYYPTQLSVVYRNRDPRPDDMFTILEYDDDKETVLVLVGQKRDDAAMMGRPEYNEQVGQTEAVIMERTPNRTGICPVVMPGTINLDRSMGLFDGTLGMYQTQAKLMAVAVQGAFLEILPETWAVARPNENVKIITQPDPLRGVTGEIQGGDVKHVVTQGSQTGMQMIDTLERNQRVSGGVPAEFGGESASNIRTGRRGDAVLSATVDFTIQECQEILAESLQEENRRAIAVMRTYFGRRKVSLWVNWDKAVGKLDYTPNDVFAESDRQIVRYSYAGADANNFVITAGQRLGLGTLSKKTFMEVDPLIPDAEREHDYVLNEAMETALLQSIQQGIASESIPLTDAVRIAELLRGGNTLLDAVNTAQKEAQKRQATQPTPGTPPGSPEEAAAQGAQPGTPETQPGLNAAGAGGEAGPVPTPNPSIDNLSMMLRGLRRSGGPTPSQAAVPVS